jgi:hypothetical protein
MSDKEDDKVSVAASKKDDQELENKEEVEGGM